MPTDRGTLIVTPEDSRAWRPTLPGWSDDVLPFYEGLAYELPDGARVAEVGVAWGRSVLFLAERLLALGKTRAALWAVDTWDPEWDWPAEDTPAGAWRFPRQPMLGALVEHATGKELDMVRIVRAPSVTASRLFEDETLDAVFLDADHTEGGIAADLDAWASKVRPGGWLAGHDYDPRRFPAVVRVVSRFAETNAKDVGPLNMERTVWTLRRK